MNRAANTENPQGQLELPIGAKFSGRYRILQRLRSGGMGAIYEVMHLETRRRRALKVMLPSLVSDSELRARFEREATIAAGIHSDHIVETLDAGVDAETGMPFLVMELLEGMDLMQLLMERGRLSTTEVVTLLSQAAQALERTHAAGVVHRDLKPQNLFLTHRDDGSPRLKVLDFGIARLIVHADDSTAVLGTPLYMPREQLQGEGTIGPSADIHALAQVAFTLLVGTPYWAKEQRSADNTFAMLIKISNGPQESAVARAAAIGVVLPPAFDVWFKRATAIDPAARYPSASALIAELAAALGERLDAVPPAGLYSAALRRRTPAADDARGRRIRRATNLIAAAVAVLTLSSVSYWRIVARPKAATAAAGASFPRSCRDIRAQNPQATDGEYSIRIGEGSGWPVQVYCHDMAGNPREYLTLPRSAATGDSRANCSHAGEGGNTAPGGLTTCFTRLRFLPDRMGIDTKDFTFVQRSGAYIDAKFGPPLIPFADASDCAAERSMTGWATINLTGTPFGVLGQQFVLNGWRPAGKANLHAYNQKAELAGGGLCGGIGLRNNLADNTVGFDVEPLRLRWARNLYLATRDGRGAVLESGAYGPDRFKHWKLVVEVSTRRVVAMSTHQGEMIAIRGHPEAGYSLYHNFAFGHIAEEEWQRIGEAGSMNGASALASDQGSIYVAAGGRIFTVAPPKLDRVDAGAAPPIASLAATGGKLYAISEDTLLVCEHDDPRAPQTCTRWSSVGAARGIRVLALHQGRLIGAAQHQIFARSGDEKGVAAEWTPIGQVGDGTDAIIAMTSSDP